MPEIIVGHTWPLFLIFACWIKVFIAGFKPGTSGVGGNCSANCAKSVTAHILIVPLTGGESVAVALLAEQLPSAL